MFRVIPVPRHRHQGQISNFEPNSLPNTCAELSYLDHESLMRQESDISSSRPNYEVKDIICRIDVE